MEGVSVNAEDLQTLVEAARDYLLSHGLVYRTVESPGASDVVSQAPVTLLPSPVPDHLYHQAQHVQNDINLLMHRVAHDYTFLKEALQQVIKVDEFTRNLWEIYNTVYNEGISQPYSLGMTRSDYMFDCGIPTQEVISSQRVIEPEACKLRMIEVNLIASSFGGLSQNLKDFHRFMLHRLEKHTQVKQIPPKSTEPDAMHVLSKGLMAAWDVYNNHNAVILFVVDEVERNVYDQRHLEYSVYNINPKVKVIRRTPDDLIARAQLTTKNNLVIDGDEVAVVYLRTLYSPEQVPTKQHWCMRLMLERSRAIKCPSVAYQLTGTKKIQQMLAQPGVVERYITDTGASSRIRNTFTRQYSLDLDEEGNKAVAMAMENPHLYVLKPQREGGGNNTFGEEIVSRLTELGADTERTAYILMEHIHPYPVLNYLLRTGQPLHQAHCVNELGVYGTFVGTEDTVIVNHSGGCCLRTKTVGTNEGGVATGYSCLDSPLLVSSKHV